jgi:hypothetical protein
VFVMFSLFTVLSLFLVLNFSQRIRRGGLEPLCRFRASHTIRVTSKVSSSMSIETNFNSKQPKQEPRLFSALSETKLYFRLFRFNIETASNY